MHSHDQTLLAKLGFHDPDRKEGLHDMACQYLRGQAEGLLQVVSDRRFEEVRTEMEHFIQKPSGATVGFVDLMVAGVFNTYDDFADRRSYLNADGSVYRDRFNQTISISGGFSLACVPLGVEVKIKPVAVGDILRQIKLYKAHSWVKNWIVVTAYDTSLNEVNTLAREGIEHLQLGELFDRWVFEATRPKYSSNRQI